MRFLRSRVNDAIKILAALPPSQPCPHLSHSGIDQTELNDSDKVWRCDSCGELTKFPAPSQPPERNLQVQETNQQQGESNESTSVSSNEVRYGSPVLGNRSGAEERSGVHPVVDVARQVVQGPAHGPLTNEEIDRVTDPLTRDGHYEDCFDEEGEPTCGESHCPARQPSVESIQRGAALLAQRGNELADRVVELESQVASQPPQLTKKTLNDLIDQVEDEHMTNRWAWDSSASGVTAMQLLRDAILSLPSSVQGDGE